MQLTKMRHNLMIMDPARGAKRNIDDPPKGPRWVRYQDIQEPMHWAASIGDFVAVKEMICGLEGSKMFNGNDQDNAGRTPLIKACASGTKDTVDVLLKDYYQTPRPDPIDVNIADNLGWTALFYSAGIVVGFFVERLVLTQPGLILAAGGHVDIIQALLRKKSLKLDHRDIMGRTALHIASLHCHPAAAKLLLLKGAAIEQHDASGRTPLHAAAAAQYGFLHTTLANPPDRKLRIVHIDQSPLPAINFAIPALPSQKGSTLLDVLKEDSASRRRTGGFATWGPADSTSDQASLRAMPTLALHS